MYSKKYVASTITDTALKGYYKYVIQYGIYGDMSPSSIQKTGILTIGVGDCDYAAPSNSSHSFIYLIGNST